MINTVGKDMRLVETSMDTTAIFEFGYSVSEQGNIITRTYRAILTERGCRKKSSHDYSSTPLLTERRQLHLLDEQ